MDTSRARGPSGNFLERRSRIEPFKAAKRARNAALSVIARSVLETDELTGIGNRRAFNRALKNLATKVRRGRHADGALIFIDLNEFKAINDTLGHAEGDNVLKAFADVLSRTVRNYDTTFRLRRKGQSPHRFGGDEFGVLIQGANPEIAEKISARINDAVEMAFVGTGVSASIGYGTIREVVGIDFPFNKKQQPAIQSKLLSIVDGKMYEMKALARQG